jgi:hypothetical protein
MWVCQRGRSNESLLSVIMYASSASDMFWPALVGRGGGSCSSLLSACRSAGSDYCICDDVRVRAENAWDDEQPVYVCVADGDELGSGLAW